MVANTAHRYGHAFRVLFYVKHTIDYVKHYYIHVFSLFVFAKHETISTFCFL